jgi:hypothetical protein
MELSEVIAHMDCHSILGAGVLLNVLGLAIYTLNESAMAGLPMMPLPNTKM